MGMTIAVYRINPQTGERTVLRKRYSVRPAALPAPTGIKLPPCSCELCQQRQQAGGYRDKSGTVQAR
jgi:hypothetical protein